MIWLKLLTFAVIILIGFGIFLCGAIIWMMIARRDELYRVKQQHFLDQRTRVQNKLGRSLADEKSEQ